MLTMKENDLNLQFCNAIATDGVLFFSATALLDESKVSGSWYWCGYEYSDCMSNTDLFVVISDSYSFNVQGFQQIMREKRENEKKVKFFWE